MNHDWYAYKKRDHFQIKCALLGITYLEDESVTINGIKFYGTPWVTKFYDWAFMKYDQDLSKIWNKIPTDTDVLLSHGPAYGYLDKVQRGNVGSKTLETYINSLPSLRYHIFGHIHEGCNQEIRTHSLRRINASCLDEGYRQINDGRVINITKELK